MSRFDLHGLVEAEVGPATLLVRRDGFEEETDMIAESKPLQHPTDEPVLAILQDRQPTRTLPPGATGEFIHVIAGAATE
jgi:hypothetical protein